MYFLLRQLQNLFQEEHLKVQPQEAQEDQEAQEVEDRHGDPGEEDRQEDHHEDHREVQQRNRLPEVTVIFLRLIVL